MWGQVEHLLTMADLENKYFPIYVISYQPQIQSLLKIKDRSNKTIGDCFNIAQHFSWVKIQN